MFLLRVGKASWLQWSSLSWRLLLTFAVTECRIFLPSAGFVFLEGLFCLLFTAELALRIQQQHWAFFQDSVKFEKVRDSAVNACLFQFKSFGGPSSTIFSAVTFGLDRRVQASPQCRNVYMPSQVRKSELLAGTVCCQRSEAWIRTIPGAPAEMHDA